MEDIVFAIPALIFIVLVGIICGKLAVDEFSKKIPSPMVILFCLGTLVAILATVHIVGMVFFHVDILA